MRKVAIFLLCLFTAVSAYALSLADLSDKDAAAGL